MYHYTNEAGYNGIYNFYDAPKDCIMLRFTRIDQSVRNDSKERKHIIDTVIKCINMLLNQNKISADFAKHVKEFVPKEEGINTASTNSLDERFHNYPVRISWGKTDYYMACFSINPNNTYIIKKYDATRCISFNSTFTGNIVNRQLGMIHVNFVPNLRELNPFYALMEAGLYFEIKKIIYKSSQQFEIINRELLSLYSIHKNLDKKEKLENDLANMYAEYDGFIKPERIDDEEYHKEEEVRFLIRFPRDQNYNKEILEMNHTVFENYTPDGRPRSFLLPINKMFLENDG